MADPTKIIGYSPSVARFRVDRCRIHLRDVYVDEKLVKNERMQESLGVGS